MPIQEVANISDANQLIRYATAGQLELLCRQQSGVMPGHVAYGARLGGTRANASATLTNALKTHLTYGQLQRLDEIIGALVPDLDGTGGLCSLALRLSAEPRGGIKGSSLIPHVPSSWTGKILNDPLGGEVGVLLQAAALVSAFGAADKLHADGRSVTSIRLRYHEEMDWLVRRLIIIAVGPPTSRNYDAQILLGMLASYALVDKHVKGLLDTELRNSPLGFRVWRAITKLVMLNARSSNTDPLRAWVSGLIRDSGELRESSLYPGRSLDLELAITVPAAWSPLDDDWVKDALLERAMNPAATIRERGTAVMGLWQRAIVEDRGLRKSIDELRDLIRQFREPGARPDAAAGLRWVAALLEQAIEEQVPVCNDWPDVGEIWFRNVQAAADQIDRSDTDIPADLRPGAKNLFKHMILQNAGVYRRQAIETVVTSGWSEPVAKALKHLLKNETEESWLRIRVLFALSLLQRPDLVESDLVNACTQAYENLKLGPDLDEEPPRTRITEMHAALFAVGDCFGVEGVTGDLVRSVRERLRSVLTNLVLAEEPRASILHRAARAAAYLLTVTAQPRQGGRKDLSEELLEVLSCHSDPVTAGLSRWALGFRFAPDGTIRPLLAAAEKHNDNLS